MGPLRAIVGFLGIILASALVYLMAVHGEDPINGPDPRVCAETGGIMDDTAIVRAALGQAIRHNEPGTINYASIDALNATGPHVRFNSDWHWQKWRDDRSVRMGLRNSGLQYAYTVTVAYRHKRGGDKPFTVETYRLDECARPIGTGEAVSRGAWSETNFNQARQRPDTVS